MILRVKKQGQREERERSGSTFRHVYVLGAFWTAQKKKKGKEKGKRWKEREKQKRF